MAVNIELNAHKVNGQSFDYVFDCRGLGAKQAEPLLRGVRGEVARLYAPEVNLNQTNTTDASPLPNLYCS